MSRKPHHTLPSSLTEPALTFILQTQRVLHDIHIDHITIEREALQQWLNKGGCKARLRGTVWGSRHALTFSISLK
ncbi:MAG: ATPase RavA [Sodalis sp.]|uniref:regulatory ATPase RavA LARA domain-containing protein n=1 Tax=Sodalis sp. (in: enterobacteria) TaxID=1898979 RepID=UPI003873215C|nr:MAG: ATPase RavA [Sodalis sp.]